MIFPKCSLFIFTAKSHLWFFFRSEIPVKYYKRTITFTFRVVCKYFALLTSLKSWKVPAHTGLLWYFKHTSEFVGHMCCNSNCHVHLMTQTGCGLASQFRFWNYMISALNSTSNLSILLHKGFAVIPPSKCSSLWKYYSTQVFFYPWI